MYYDSLDADTRAYFRILSPDFPDWLEDYIKTPEMQRVRGISMVCGCQFLNFWHTPNDYNILDHSVACALIVWHFTGDKAQTLAALFHDIGSPAFKHCVDVFNGDALTQESTEAPTYSIIKNSKEIRALLRRDQIRPKQVADYHLYPLADNDTPRLSSDRLEYTFMNAHKVDDYGVIMPLSRIKRFYGNLVIGKNEDSTPEMAFMDYKIAQEFLDVVHDLWHNWLDNRFQLTSKGYSKLIARAIKVGDFTAEDLYTLTDAEAAEKLRNSKDAKLRQNFIKFCKVYKVSTSNKKPAKTAGKFIVPAFPVKIRYIDPLVCTDFTLNIKTGKTEASYTRLSKISKSANSHIKRIQNYPVKQYAWLNFML